MKPIHYGAPHVTGGLAAIGPRGSPVLCLTRPKREYTYIIASPQWRRVTCKKCKQRKRK